MSDACGARQYFLLVVLSLIVQNQPKEESVVRHEGFLVLSNNMLFFSYNNYDK